jgi:hypothetical protein
MSTISWSVPPGTVEAVYLRPQSVAEILAASLNLLRHRFWRFAGVYLAATVPAHLMLIYGQTTGQTAVGLVGLLLLFLALTAVQPLLTIMIGDICRGMEPSLRRAAALTLRRLPVVILNSVIVLIIIVLGFMLFVVPGIIALIQLMFVAPVSTLEEKRWGIAALRRSRQLGSGFHWRNFRAFGLALLFAFGIALIAMPIVMLLQTTNIPGLDVLFQNIVNGITQIVGLIVSVLLYYELRARKEGLTPDVLMQDLSAGS